MPSLEGSIYGTAYTIDTWGGGLSLEATTILVLWAASAFLLSGARGWEEDGGGTSMPPLERSSLLWRAHSACWDHRSLYIPGRDSLCLWDSQGPLLSLHILSPQQPPACISPAWACFLSLSLWRQALSCSRIYLQHIFGEEEHILPPLEQVHWEGPAVFILGLEQWEEAITTWRRCKQ